MAASEPDVAGPRLELRAFRDEDVEPLAAILAEPEVAAWWPRYDVERTRREFTEDPNQWIVEVGGEVAGCVLYEEETEPDYRHVAFDIAIATRLHGGGYGTEALRTAIGHFAGKGHHRFTIDPAAHNERAIRAYAAVGFKPVGVHPAVRARRRRLLARRPADGPAAAGGQMGPERRGPRLRRGSQSSRSCSGTTGAAARRSPPCRAPA